jgi:hypothetical protein
MFFATLSSACPRALIIKCLDSMPLHLPAALSEDNDYSMRFRVVKRAPRVGGSADGRLGTRLARQALRCVLALALGVVGSQHPL